MAGTPDPQSPAPRRFRGVTATPPEEYEIETAPATETPPPAPSSPPPARGRRLLLLVAVIALVAGGLLLGRGLLGSAARNCETSFVTAARDKLSAGGWQGVFSYTRRSAAGMVAGEPIEFAVESASRWSRVLRSVERGDSELRSIDGQVWTRDGAGVWGVRPGSGWGTPTSEIWAGLPGDAVWTALDRSVGADRCIFEARSALEGSFLGTLEIPDGGYWPSRLALEIERLGLDGVRSVELRELLVTPGAVTIETPR